MGLLWDWGDGKGRTMRVKEQAVTEDGHSPTPAPAPPRTGASESPPPLERLLTVRMVADRLAVSPRQVWRMSTTGQFPQPITIGLRCKRWRAGEVEQFLSDLRPESSQSRSLGNRPKGP
ncbi:MAG: helix-turn-helix transcriptional regulator [Rhodanobacteraceae bacterium]